MELEVYKKSDFYEDYIDSQKEYYERTNADAYFAERLAEKDKAIALLKERICNGDVSRLTWIDDCIAKDKEIAELKSQKAQAEDDCAYWKMSEGNAVNAMHETEEYAMQLYNELRHQKFKRCLAMAKFCQYRSETFFTWSKKMGFLLKWQKRWQELAERFK